MDVGSISPKLEQVPSAWSISSLVMQTGEGIFRDVRGMELMEVGSWGSTSSGAWAALLSRKAEMGQPLTLRRAWMANKSQMQANHLGKELQLPLAHLLWKLEQCPFPALLPWVLAAPSSLCFPLLPRVIYTQECPGHRVSCRTGLASPGILETSRNRGWSK